MFVTNSQLLIKHTELFNKVIPYYNESHRFYHNWNHIIYGFLLFEEIKDFKVDLVTELAWIFHDSIYLPFNFSSNNKNHTNEKLSCQFLEFFLKSNDINFYNNNLSEIRESQQIILATENHIPFDERSSIILDVDMSYLGYSYEKFTKIRELVRLEYKFIDDKTFYDGTLSFINNLLTQEKIYFSEYGISHWEKNARENLKKEKESILKIL
jgi:predicted metal-dependent HD superfamily phosphohydrolase